MQLLILAAFFMFASHAALAETVYVSNEQDNTVSVIDGATLKLTDTIKVGRCRVADDLP